MVIYAFSETSFFPFKIQRLKFVNVSNRLERKCDKFFTSEARFSWFSAPDKPNQLNKKISLIIYSFFVTRRAHSTEKERKIREEKRKRPAQPHWEQIFSPNSPFSPLNSGIADSICRSGASSVHAQSIEAPCRRDGHDCAEFACPPSMSALGRDAAKWKKIPVNEFLLWFSSSTRSSENQSTNSSHK